jgi:hypothetical protein
MRSPVADLLAEAGQAFREGKIDWYLFGAQAAILYGVARLTADVDVTVRLPSGQSALALTAALESHGFAARVTDPAFVTRTSVIPFLHRSTSLPLDIVLAGPGLEDRFFERAAVREIEGVPVRVASAEDIVVMKILASRPKDIDDVIAVLSAQGGALDAAYVTDTLKLLEDALAQDDLLPAFRRALERARL